MSDLPRLTYQQYQTVRRLVHDCCNYDRGNCLALDNGWEPCVCVQSITYSLVCKWFRAAVLPTDNGLCAALFHRGRARPCAECGTMFVPRSNRGKYCDRCAANVRQRKKAASERERRKRGHLDLCKPCYSKACRRPSKGGWYFPLPRPNIGGRMALTWPHSPPPINFDER